MTENEPTKVTITAWSNGIMRVDGTMHDIGYALLERERTIAGLRNELAQALLKVERFFSECVRLRAELGAMTADRDHWQSRWENRECRQGDEL